jgi:hypothetical protein
MAPECQVDTGDAGRILAAFGRHELAKLNVSTKQLRQSPGIIEAVRARS